MSIREDFEKAKDYQIEKQITFIDSPHDFEVGALWAALWAMKKCEEACMSPTSKGRIIQLAKELEEA